MATYDPFQRYQGYAPRPTGGGAAGEFLPLLSQKATPRSMFTGLSVPSAPQLPMSPMFGAGAAPPLNASSFVPSQSAALPATYSVDDPKHQNALAGGAGADIGGMLRGRFPALSGKDPNNPHGYDPVWTPTSIILNLLGGTLDPNSPFSEASFMKLLDSLRGRMDDNSGALQNRAALAGQLYGGGDPSRAGYAALEGAMRGQSDGARTVGDFYAKGMTHQRDFLEQLLMLLAGGANNRLFNNPNQNPIDWGAAGGGIGSIIGAIPWGGK